MNFIFPFIGNVIIPTDKYFSEGLKPPTSQWWHCLKQEFSEYPWSTRFFGAPRKRKEFLRQFCCKWRTRRTRVGVLNSCCCTGRMWEIAKHTTTFDTIYGDFLNIPIWGVPQIIKVIETHGMVTTGDPWRSQQITTNHHCTYRWAMGLVNWLATGLYMQAMTHYTHTQL